MINVCHFVKNPNKDIDDSMVPDTDQWKQADIWKTLAFWGPSCGRRDPRMPLKFMSILCSRQIGQWTSHDDIQSSDTRQPETGHFPSRPLPPDDPSISLLKHEKHAIMAARRMPERPWVPLFRQPDIHVGMSKAVNKRCCTSLFSHLPNRSAEV